MPGDPVQIMYAQSQGTTPEQLEEIRQSLGLDRPIPEQYVRFIGRLLHGDLGTTVRGQQPVLDLILQRLPNTLAARLLGHGRWRFSSACRSGFSPLTGAAPPSTRA